MILLIIANKKLRKKIFVWSGSSLDRYLENFFKKLLWLSAFKPPWLVNKLIQLDYNYFLALHLFSAQLDSLACIDARQIVPGLIWHGSNWVKESQIGWTTEQLNKTSLPIL